MGYRSRTTAIVTRILRDIGWTIAACCIVVSVALPCIILMIKLSSLTWGFSRFGSITTELLFSLGEGFTLALILLFATRRAGRLNRSMLWVLVAFATWDLLNAPLPLLGMKPIGLDTFFFYDFRNDGGWVFTAVVVLRAMSQFAGITLYLLWKQNRYQGKNESNKFNLLTTQ